MTAGNLPGDAGHLDVAMATARFAPVFPCLPSKQPATAHGFKDATLDQDRIYQWWSKHPRHLVGIPTQGLVIVDLDEPDPPTGDSWRAWWTMAVPHSWQATTCPMIATPSGGTHIYWEAPEGVSVRNSAGRLAAGIDIRGDGGYVIAPGSRLPDGREYELLNPFPAKLPEAPQWLIAACNRQPSVPTARPTAPDGQGGTPYGLRALESELGRLAVAPDGARNDTLNRAAHALGQLVAGQQVDPDHAVYKLHEVALRIGLTPTEIEATIRSGMAVGARQPRTPANAR